MNDLREDIGVHFSLTGILLLKKHLVRVEANRLPNNKQSDEYSAVRWIKIMTGDTKLCILEMKY